MEGYAAAGVVFNAAVDVATQNLVPNPKQVLFLVVWHWHQNL